MVAVQPPPLPPRIEIEEVSQTKRKWILELHPDHFALHSEFEPRPWVFTRDEMWDKVELMPAMGLLTVKAPRGVGFKLGLEGLAAFKQWLGPPTAESLRGVLKKRFSSVWVSALIIVGMSMPSPRFPLNPIFLALGLLLAGAWAWGMWRPARIHFLLYGAWYLASGGYLILQTVNGRSKFLLALAILWLLMAWRAFKWFAWFGGAKAGNQRPQPTSAT
jgi:hypothetical protein